MGSAAVHAAGGVAECLKDEVHNVHRHNAAIVRECAIGAVHAEGEDAGGRVADRSREWDAAATSVRGIRSEATCAGCASVAAQCHITLIAADRNYVSAEVSGCTREERQRRAASADTEVRRGIRR